MLIEEPGMPDLTVIKRVQVIVAASFGVTLEELMSASRTKTIATARVCAMALAREISGCSYPELGRAFGRDHTTVMSACKGGVRRLCERDERMARRYDWLRAEIVGRPAVAKVRIDVGAEKAVAAE